MIVFVHGVPETAALWDKLRGLVDQDSVALGLPGFGSERPPGFGATKDEYADWLRGELERIGGPIDLVGHDWGAGITYRIATAHGHLVRSWVADVANVLHPDYVWHDFARIWQTPGEGEAFFESQADAPAEERGAVFEAFGVPHDDAVALAAASDPTMSSCILDLYRSAVPNAFRDWGDAMRPTAARGMVVHPTEDPFGDATLGAEVATMLGADFEPLPGLGHWWMLQAPEAVAPVLDRFWKSAG